MQPTAAFVALIPLVAMATAGHYRHGGEANGNATHKVHTQLTSLRLSHFAHRGSLHVDRVELRSESNDRHAFYVHNPSDPAYPLWTAARPSVASVWPQPASERRSRRRFALGAGFSVVVDGPKDDVVADAVSRYSELLLLTVTAVTDEEAEIFGEIRTLTVRVRNSTFSVYPHEHMREDYEIVIDSSGILLTAQENWGVVRGMETVSQLIFVTRRDPKTFLIHENRISDRPVYRHRGLMVDTARHFIHKSTLLENLEAMSYNKMNVFHWHIVDDQSFPYLSKRFPQLALKSAYAGGHYFYTASDISDVVEFARLRGIRVVPEFDSPDHTHSWGHAVPGIMSWCNQGNLAYMGPLNPIHEGTYKFLAEFFAEVTELFPDEYLHLGMDEVSLSCWRLNATFQQYMKRAGLKQYEQLVTVYCNRLVDLVSRLPKRKKVIVWEDILSKDSPELPLNLPSNSIVQVWVTRDSAKVHSWQKKYKVIRSEEWYLDHQGYGADWVKRYQFNPGGGIGGEACMWTEYQSDETVTPHTWPSVSAVAERLWVGGAGSDAVMAAPRIEEQNCRMQARGIRSGVAGGPAMCQTPAKPAQPVWLSRHWRERLAVAGIEANLTNAFVDTHWQQQDSVCLTLKLLLFAAVLGLALHRLSNSSLRLRAWCSSLTLRPPKLLTWQLLTGLVTLYCVCWLLLLVYDS